jgi:hypothetical protein
VKELYDARALQNHSCSILLERQPSDLNALNVKVGR